MTAVNLYKQNQILASYIRRIKQEKMFDKKTEFAVATEIRELETERWTELLCDTNHPEVLDPALIKGTTELYGEEAADAVIRGLRRLRATEYTDPTGENITDEFWGALDSLLLVLDVLDKKRRLFLTMYSSLNIRKDDNPVLHPDTIWNIDVLDARIGQLKHRFINANLHLVVSIARQYDFGMVPLVDLIQEGNMGLLSAVDRFDYTMGFRFSTFATSWIRNAIRKALAHMGNTVRIPPRVIDEKHKVRSAVHKYELEHGHEPSDAELAELLEVSGDQLKRIKARPAARVYPLDMTDNDSESTRYANVLIDETNDIPEDSVMLKSWLRKKDQLLDVLTNIEKAIICWRFGLEDGDEKTLRQIGNECNLSKERIRQIQNVALKKLYLAFTGM